MAARTPRTLAAVVLAAGKGKRLRSDTPKVLHPVAGKPALWHVLQLVAEAAPSKIAVVIGHGGEDVKAAVRSWDVTPAPVFVTQTEQLGTGHAVLVARRAVGSVDDVLVANGDFDPLGPGDVKALVRRHRRTGTVATLASSDLREPGGYGRVVRDARGRVTDLVEGIDASPAIRAIHEVATNWIVVRRADLFRALPKLDRANRQREYYLPRVVPMLLAGGDRIDAVLCDTGGVMGLNSRSGLADVERLVRRRVNAGHMAAGVTLVDPDVTYIDVGITIGRDSVIYPNTYLQGASTIGRGCTIGPSTVISDSEVGDGSEIWFSVVLESRIGRHVQVGPFVRLRLGVEMGDRSRAGAFVDMKQARLGRGTKVPHLSYLGDAMVGEDVNIGAGTITANYDGYAKHQTVIEDGARIGSDTMLVAPVRIGRDANTGAGSVITQDVPAGALAVERSEQRTVPGYRARKDTRRRGKAKGA